MTEAVRSIGVYCSASDLEPKYTEPAEEFVGLLAANGFNLVYGGSDKGLMKAIATRAQRGGSKIIGVTIPHFQHIARENADEMIVAATLGERKMAILERSDAIMGLVGGIGTLDEITEMIELKKQGKHNKPIVILDTAGFYSGLKTQLQKMKDDGFIPNDLEELVHFSNTPKEAIEYIKANLAV